MGPAPSASAQQLAAALADLAEADAVSLAYLSEAACKPLLAAIDGIAFKAARSTVGEGERAVHQDFEICMNPPPPSPFRDCAAALEDLLARALAGMPAPPLAAAPPLNDLAVQRYAPGSRGITPHRDHVRYRELVAIVTLAGRARFFVCETRDGRNAREVPIPAGSLLLMRAPGFAGRDARPFHFLQDVTETRVCLGLRYDTRA